MSKTPKKRKFQIEPNSLSAVEENATRSVLRRLRNPSSATEEIAAEIEKKNSDSQKIEAVSPPPAAADSPRENVVNHTAQNVVYHQNKSVVNHKKPLRSTTNKSVVNKITTNDELFTTLKKSENVVNHKKRDWSTTNKRRSSYGNEVESFRTSSDFKQKIKVFCAEKGIDKQDFYRIVVDHYFESVVYHKNESVVGLFTLDDLKIDILWKSSVFLINLYLQYNFIFNEKTKWSMKDDEAGMRFNNVDIRLVELGIIQTQSNKNFAGKINTFGYYANEIQNFIDLKMPSEALDTMLKINRQRWRQATGREIDLTFLNKTTDKKTE